MNRSPIDFETFILRGDAEDELARVLAECDALEEETESLKQQLTASRDHVKELEVALLEEKKACSAAKIALVTCQATERIALAAKADAETRTAEVQNSANTANETLLEERKAMTGLTKYLEAMSMKLDTFGKQNTPKISASPAYEAEVTLRDELGNIRKVAITPMAH